MDLTLRGLTDTDVPDWCRLLADVERVDSTGEHYNEADLREEMANPDLDPARDVVGAFDGEDLVGYFLVYPRGESEGRFTVLLEGAVRHDRRGQGIGSRLVTAMLARAEEARTERRPDLPPRFMLRGLSDNTAQERLLTDAGFRPARWNFAMRVQLDDVPEPAPFPPGYRLRRYDDSLATAMHEAHNAAFVDHPNFTAWTEAGWKQWVTGSRNFRPALSFVVVSDDSTPSEGATDEVVAYVQTNEFDAHTEATGRREAFVAKVGTRREHRGRGLASTLLQHCLAAYQEAGYDEAALDVDSENPTGALGVYRRAGFEVERRWTNYLVEGER